MATVLEYLPDEILLITCQYLSQYQIINAFWGLNSRLNCTISQFLRTLMVSNEYYLDDVRTRKLLSIIGPYLHSLTIKQIHLSYDEISLASNIQELTFIHTQPDTIPVLNNLTDLNIITGPSFQSIDILFSKNNNLHSVYIASTSPLTIPSLVPKTFSTIKQLAITLQSSEDFIRLLSLCPELTCLNLILRNCKLENQLKIDTPSNLRLFSLRTTYEINVNFDDLKILFKYLTSKLEHLSIEIDTDDITCLDGQLWENYLKKNFPELNRLEFLILLREEGLKGSQSLRLSDILKTFQSIYWSSIVPQNITGYYNRTYAGESICIHTEIIPTVQRRRYFLY